MQPRSLTRLSRLRGFTLVELMIVVVIASILLSVAVPSYLSSLRKARRADAKTAVLELAGREERYLSTNPAGYTTNPADLGFTGFGNGNPVGTGQYYYISVVCITGGRGGRGLQHARGQQQSCRSGVRHHRAADGRHEPGQ